MLALNNLASGLVMALGLSMPSLALAQAADPVGHWSASGYGVHFDLFIEPSPDAQIFPAYVVVSAPQGGWDCDWRSRFIASLCEIVEKDGPQVRRMELAIPSGQGIGSSRRYEGLWSWAGVDRAMTFHMSPQGDVANLVHSEEREGRPSPALATARLRDPKPSPSSDLFEGNWVADFGMLRIEAAFSPDGAGAVTGSLAPHAVDAPDFRGNGSRISNFHKAAENFYPFLMSYRGALGANGSFYVGNAQTGPDYTEIGQEGLTRLLPLSNGLIVAEIQNLDWDTYSEPFLFVPLDGALTPVPSLPGARSGNLELDGGSQTITPQDSGDENAESEESGTIAGVWTARHGGTRYSGFAPNANLLPGGLDISADEQMAEIAMGSYSAVSTAVRDDSSAEQITASLDAWGTLGGQSASQWLGGPGIAHRIERPDSLGGTYLVSRGNRGIYLVGINRNDPISDLMFGGVHQGHMLLLDRVSGPDGQALNQGSSGADLGTSGQTQLGVPPRLPAEGAAAIVWSADPNEACAALSDIQDGLWAGAEAGTVRLGQLRILLGIISASRSGSQQHCRAILTRLQAAVS